MSKPLSPIHRSLDNSDPEPALPRVVRLAQLDIRRLASRAHSLGAGGASAAFGRAVEKALIDEMAEQLRCGRRGAVCESDGDIAVWAADIIAAFREEG